MNFFHPKSYQALQEREWRLSLHGSDFHPWLAREWNLSWRQQRIDSPPYMPDSASICRRGISSSAGWCVGLSPLAILQ